MASVPNTRDALCPAPGGKAPAAAGDPAAFASKFAQVPEQLMRMAAAIVSGGGETPAADGDAETSGDAATADPADASSDAAQLAALMPLLQPLPALVPAPAAPAPQPETAATIETAAAMTPAPTAMPPAPGAPATGKIGRAKPGTDADSDSQEPKSVLDAAAKEAIIAAKRVIEAALRLGGQAHADTAPKAARVAASTLQGMTEAQLQALAPAADAGKAGADVATPTAFNMPVAPAPAQTASIQPREAAAPVADRALDLANDAEWLDRLARDIAQASGSEGTIRFRLNPNTLGHLRVELSQGDHGTSIRLTADTEQARAILSDAQPRLIAEARAQGVRIAETHVDLSGSDRHFSGDPRRQDDARQTPFIRTARDAAADAIAPDRSGPSRSDRYA